MNYITYTLWLAKQSLGVLHYVWPVSLALVAAMLVATNFNTPFLRSRFHRRHLLVFLPLGVSLLILVWGSVMCHTDQHSLAPNWPSHVILGLLIAQVLTGMGVVWSLKDYRWFSAAAVLLEQWLGVAFAFAANCSVTGKWP
jgi:hypothetical protein